MLNSLTVKTMNPNKTTIFTILMFAFSLMIVCVASKALWKLNNPASYFKGAGTIERKFLLDTTRICDLDCLFQMCVDERLAQYVITS